MNQAFLMTVSLCTDPGESFTFFTENERLQTWLTEIADIEPEVGGRYELFWDPDDRENNSTIGCRVTAVVPGQLLAFDWKSPVQFKHFANFTDPLTHVVVTFIPNGSTTDVHVVHSGWRNTPEWRKACEWQRKAWQMALNRLASQVNGG